MLDIEKIKSAINIISAEKKIPEAKLVGIIESAIKTAYKKDYGTKDENVNVKLDLSNSTLEITVEKMVVKVVENPNTEISFEELGEDGEGYEEGDLVEIDMTDEILNADGGESFGRIASQAARQVIIQKIGDTEKEKIYEIFKDKKGQVINMKIEMIEGGKVTFDYNGNQVILPKSEQVSKDNYTIGNRLYLYVAEVVHEENMAPKIVLSRKRAEIVPAIFAEFVPEIGEGIITIDKVVRHPGVKTKVLVSSAYPEIDPVGTLIGQKGIRVKSVMDELGGEKIDIIPNSDDIAEVVIKSLSPAKVLKVEPGNSEDSVIAFISAGDRAKAVGKNGLNVNLASKLTGYKISIQEVE